MSGVTEEVTAKIAGQEISVKSMHLNTLATVASLMMIAVLLFMVFNHMQDAREANAHFTSAVKEFTTVSREQTGAMREYTCMARTDFQDKNAQAEYCRRLGR